MFGDKEIVGERIIKFDQSKKRIILPSFTGVEPGDEIGEIFYIKKAKILLYKLKDYCEEMDRLKKALKIGCADKMITTRESFIMNSIFHGITYETKADSNRRISLLERPLKKLNVQDSFYAVGEGKALALYLSRNDYLNRKVK